MPGAGSRQLLLEQAWLCTFCIPENGRGQAWKIGGATVAQALQRPATHRNPDEQSAELAKLDQPRRREVVAGLLGA